MPFEKEVSSAAVRLFYIGAYAYCDRDGTLADADTTLMPEYRNLILKPLYSHTDNVPIYIFIFKLSVQCILMTYFLIRHYIIYWIMHTTFHTYIRKQRLIYTDHMN